MNNDNYKAPAAAVMDAPERELPERPRNVNYALGLIAAAVLIQLIARFTDRLEVPVLQWNIWGLLIDAAVLLLYAVLFHRIAHARRWARLVLLILTVLAFAQWCWVIGNVWRYYSPELLEPLLGMRHLLARVLPMAMTLAALHLLYFSSGDWFQRRTP